MLPTVRDWLQHFLKRICAAQRRNDAKMGPANLLHVLIEYIEYSKRFYLIEQLKLDIG